MCKPGFQQVVDAALGSSCCHPGLQALPTAHRGHCVPQNSQALHFGREKECINRYE